MTYKYKMSSPLGSLTLYSSETALTGLYFERCRYCEDDRGAVYELSEPIITAKKWLEIYFSGRIPDFVPTLAPAGSPFRQEVYRLLLKIPYGSTESYGSIARKIAEKQGKPRISAQAVGGAVGHNPISIIIPCHRVVGSDGNLRGYGGGMDRKIKLMEIEKISMDSFFVPENS